MKLLLTIFCLLILVSCSPTPEIPSDQLVERQGITYEVNSQTPFTGGFVNYHENGQLKGKGNYKDGKLNGLWEVFSENGQIQERKNFRLGLEDGLYENFWNNGQLWTRGMSKQGKEDGLWEVFNENGQHIQLSLIHI